MWCHLAIGVRPTGDIITPSVFRRIASTAVPKLRVERTTIVDTVALQAYITTGRLLLTTTAVLTVVP